MSTLRVNTLQNAAGTGQPAMSGAAKAWVNFNGTGTVAIRASFNVTSITDNGVGDYTVNFTNAMEDANYTAVWTVGPDSTGAGPQYMLPRMTNFSAAANAYQAQTTVAIRVGSSNSAGTMYDTVVGAVVIFR